MKKQYYIWFFIIGMLGMANAQTALYNSGNIRIHPDGKIGFHTNLINNAAFDQNAGLAGFYGPDAISVSGAFMPVFYDMEVGNDQAVVLNTSVSVANNINFIVGNVVTPRAMPDVYFQFMQNAFSVGQGDASKIDGYAIITGHTAFSFPVGDSEQLRPLILNSESVNVWARCAYFYEDPNLPSTFPGFNTDRKPRTLGLISNDEFWRVEGTVPSTVTLNWNARSNMASLTDDVNTIIVVGWSKTANRWVSLGNIAMSGDLSEGFVTSDTFVPDDYEIITFGNLAVPKDILTLDNYYVSPNGDGTNDVLVIPELEQSPNNHLQIYDRFGLKVFDKINYTNEFNGFSNVDNLVINRDQGLPAGVYFYVISMDDLDLNFQGFLYLAR